MRRSLMIISWLALSGVQAQAQLTLLPDSELSRIDGKAGIGFVLENFKLDAQNLNVVINDITNTSGQNIPVAVDKLYISGTGSKKGTVLKPVTVGRLPYPINLNLAKGEDLRSFIDGNEVQTTPSGVTVAELAMPAQLTEANGATDCIKNIGLNRTCSSLRSGHMDMGLRLAFKVDNVRTDTFTIDVTDVVFDGSYLRVWGDATNQQMVGEVKLNMFAAAIDVMTCKAGDASCDTTALQNDRTLLFTNVNASIGLGYGKTQPILFDVTSDGQFVLELPNPVRDPANPTAAVDTNSGVGLSKANDFYANAPRINLSIANFTSGGPRASPVDIPMPGTGFNFGQNRITGLGFNYLKVTSRDL